LFLKNKMNKKAFFFTMDVVICIMILTIGFLLVWTSTSGEPPKEQPMFLANDIASLLSNTKNADIMGMITGGNVDYVKDPELTMFEQIGIFYVTGNSNRIEDYLDDTLKGILPDQYEMDIRFDDEVFYNSTPITKTYNESGFLISAKRVIVVVTNKTKLHGPFVGEVRVW